jgi:hypothetical protein
MISGKRPCINDTITPWYLAKDHVSIIRLPHDIWQKTMYQWYNYPMISMVFCQISWGNRMIDTWSFARHHGVIVWLIHGLFARYHGVIWQKTMYQWYNYPMISGKRSCINDTITPWYLAKDHVSIIQLPHDIWQKTMYQWYDYPMICIIDTWSFARYHGVIVWLIHGLLLDIMG